MSASRRNYICIIECGDVKKYSSQSIRQILDEKENCYDPFISIASIGLHSSDDDFEELEWHD